MFLKPQLSRWQDSTSNNITLSPDLAPESCFIEADRTRIRQLVMNLATNARDAMPDGGELRIGLATLEITPTTEPPVADLPPGTWASLAVSDTGHGETILLIEDAVPLREANTLLLTSLDYRVVAAANGSEALKRAKSLSLDLVIVDVATPQPESRARLEALQQTRPGLKALAITDYVPERALFDLKVAGFADVICQPFDLHELAKSLQGLLKETDP